ncbi:hypothetical protein CDAR_481551 [Caerostris darwini]|uniref:Single domain-containing protein n=1 Tax=Caerostris darwini TaxID=1538125 RepID=A0AAV4UWR8_9ARAC|nr:hypothetical protein CDAR_481551 [Caerostris darwini]
MFSFSFTGLLIVLIAHIVASANTYKEYVNSSIGYCEDKSRYGRITLGSSGYDNKACEKIVCGRGVLVAYRCEPLSMSKQVQLQKGCQFKKGKGHYPNCCESFICE